MEHLSLKLYVAGATARSECAIAQARRISEVKFGGRCTLEIIDVVDNPEIAERERILVTPMLIKESPLPVRRIVGDLTRLDDVLSGLGLFPLSNRDTPETKNGA